MKSKFEILLNAWISVLISIVLSAALPILAGAEITLPSYCQGFIISLVISFVLASILPVTKWGNAFAALFKQKPGSLSNQLVSTIITAFVLGTLMSFIMTAANIGFPPYFLNAWLSAYPYALIVIYVMVNISLWTGIPAVKSFLKLPDWPQQPGHKAKDMT